MKRTQLFYTLTILLTLCAGSIVYGQDDLPTGEVEVIKDYEARIIDNKKVDLSPSLPKQNTTTTPTYEYQVSSKPVSVEYGTATIRPLSLPTERNPPNYRGFLKAGYGWPSSPYGELAYQLDLGGSKKGRSRGRSRGGRSSRGAQGTPILGIYLLHHSADNSDDVLNQQFARTRGNVYFSVPTSSGFSLQGDVGYQIRDEYFFGQMRDSILTPDLSAEDARRRFQTLTASAKIFNNIENDLGINYLGEVKFYNTQDEFGFGVVTPLPVVTDAENSENGITIDLGANKAFGENNRFGLDLQTDIVSYEADYSIDTNAQNVSSELTNFFLRPYVDLHFDKFRLDVGAQLATSDGEFFVYPDVEVSAQISGDKVIAFAGADGGLEKNTFRTLTDYNPYLAPALDSGLFNTEALHIYAGVKGEVSQIQYEGRIGYTQAENIALFFQDNAYGLFRTAVDTGSIVRIGGSVRSRVTDNLRAIADVNYNIYNLDNNEEPWHLPEWEANLGLLFDSPDEKFRLRGEIFLQNGIAYLDAEGNSQNLKTLFDVNVGGEYFITKNIGAFLDLNNLANNERARWVGYPQMGINVLGGITARF